MPLVSVIIPNYNHAVYLEQRIESVLNQTFQDFEVILLDDKSTDNSLEVLCKYENHPRVSHLVVNKENSGKQFMLKQWRLGLSLAKGKYIWIAESDDWAESTFLEELVPCFDKGENIGLVHCDSFLIEQNEINSECKVRRNGIFEINIWDNDFFEKGKDHLVNYFWKTLTINNISSALFLKKELSVTINKNIKINIPVDFLICADLLTRTNLFYYKTCLNNYRIYEQSTSSQMIFEETYFIERFKEKTFLIKTLTKIDIDQSLVRRIIGTLFFTFYFGNYSYKLLPSLFCIDPLITLRLAYDIIKRKVKRIEIESPYK